MALSDQLNRLAATAKDAQDRAAAVRSKAGVDLEQDVAKARASAEAQADELRQAADERKGKLSA